MASGLWVQQEDGSTVELVVRFTSTAPDVVFYVQQFEVSMR
jgi:hypothetical protein